jgi:energy-coupling factor transporter transmembrane protein EcfT
MKLLIFVVFVISIILTLIIGEVIIQSILGVIPFYEGLYSKDLFNLLFWLIPVYSMVILVISFISMVFPFKPAGKDYYTDEDR